MIFDYWLFMVKNVGLINIIDVFFFILFILFKIVFILVLNFMDIKIKCLWKVGVIDFLFDIIIVRNFKYIKIINWCDCYFLI